MSTPPEQPVSSPKETKESLNQIQYEVISPADDELWQSYMIPFFRHERNIFEQQFPIRDRANPAYNDQLNHTALIGHSLKIPFYYGDSHKNCIVIAKKGNEVVGLSALVIDENNEIPTSFVGVGWEHTKQGIGTELTRHQLAHLKKLDIKEGQVSVWDASIAIYKKLKQTGEIASFTPDPQDLDGQVHLFTLPEEG